MSSSYLLLVVYSKVKLVAGIAFMETDNARGARPTAYLCLQGEEKNMS